VTIAARDRSARRRSGLQAWPGSGRLSSQYGQLLVDRSLHPNPVRDHHDFAVKIIRFDVPRAALQGLPG
jgi:hypothetical protein